MASNAVGITGFNALPSRMVPASLEETPVAGSTPVVPTVQGSRPLSPQEVQAREEHAFYLRELLSRNPNLSQKTIEKLVNDPELAKEVLKLELAKERQEQEFEKQALEREQAQWERYLDIKANDDFMWNIRNDVANLSTTLYNYNNLAVNYARANQMDRGTSLLLGAKHNIQSTAFFATGSIPARVEPGTISHAKGLFSDLETSAHQSYLGVQGIQPSDYELLKFTGFDRQGRTELEYRLALLANRSLANTPLSTLQSELAGLSIPSSAPASLQRLSMQVSQVGGGQPLYA